MKQNHGKQAETDDSFLSIKMASRHRQKPVFLVIYRFLHSILQINIGKKLNGRKQPDIRQCISGT